VETVLHRYRNAQGWALGVFTVTEGQGELEKMAIFDVSNLEEMRQEKVSIKETFDWTGAVPTR
jgi:hypothetical protein